MVKNLLETYRAIMEASVLPNLANLKKPAIGPGSGQHTDPVTGKMSMKTLSTADAIASSNAQMRDKVTGKAPTLTNTSAPPAGAPASKVATPIMDRAVQAQKAAATVRPGDRVPGEKVATNSQLAAQVAARAAAKRGFGQAAGGGSYKSSPAPVRPGERVPGEKVATNAQLTAQAIARKGFGKNIAGGNYKAAQTPVAPALDPKRNKALDQPNTQSNMALAQNPNINGAGGAGGSFGKQSGSGTTIKAKPKFGQAQAAAAAKSANMKGGAAGNPAPAKSNDMSWSQKVGKAMRDHVKRGGKAGDTIMVDGKKIKVAWKDKAYQNRLTKKYVKEAVSAYLNENRVVKKTAKSMLAHPQARLGKGQQSISNGRRYRIRTKPLVSEADNKKEKPLKKGEKINFEPENNNPIQ